MKVPTRRLITLALNLTALLVFAQVAFAKGPPAMITISGPGIEGEIEITDPETLEPFAFYWFNHLDRQVEEPEISGEGYLITRYVEAPGTQLGVKPWDRVTYYPDPAGGPGYVFFDGLVDPGSWTEGQGEWFRATPEGGAAMGRILGEIAGTTQPTQADARAVTVGALAVLGLVLAAAALSVMGRRTDSRAPAPG